jgi:hypothetical protein
MKQECGVDTTSRCFSGYLTFKYSDGVHFTSLYFRTFRNESYILQVYLTSYTLSEGLLAAHTVYLPLDFSCIIASFITFFCGKVTCSERRQFVCSRYLYDHLILWKVHVNTKIGSIHFLDVTVNRISEVLSEDLIMDLQSLVKGLSYWQVINPFILKFLSM